jgi:hypothetical protein
MSLSRNVNLDKMSVCHEGHEGSTDCNALQAGSVDYHGEVYHWWGSNTVDGRSMDMIKSEEGRWTKSSQCIISRLQ